MSTSTPTRTHPGIGAVARAAPAVLGGVAVLAQIVFPLTDGALPLTLGSVGLFALASLVHAAVHRGPAAALALLVVGGGGGGLAEVIGLRTGVPFGRYAYSGTLGPELLGVPVVVAAAWTMMAYPALLVARFLVARSPVGRVAGRVATVPVAAWALASWDVFLDPQMVDAGHWVWDDPSPALPGVAGIPLTNFGGWLLVAAVMMVVLDRLVPGGEPAPECAAPTAAPTAAPIPADDRVPFALYLWTYGSSVLGHVVFFGRPSVAVVGGLLMGLVAVPLAVGLWCHRSRWE